MRYHQPGATNTMTCGSPLRPATSGGSLQPPAACSALSKTTSRECGSGTQPRSRSNMRSNFHWRTLWSPIAYDDLQLPPARGCGRVGYLCHYGCRYSRRFRMVTHSNAIRACALFSRIFRAAFGRASPRNDSHDRSHPQPDADAKSPVARRELSICIVAQDRKRRQR